MSSAPDQLDAEGHGPTSREDTIDANFGGFGRPSLPTPQDVEMKDPVSKPTEMDFVYRMDRPRRGVAIILNNRNFDRRTGMNDRNGTDVDAANLYQQYMRLGFEVRMYHNQPVTEMLRIMVSAARENHKDADCFACAILSHGDEGVVYGTDGIIRIDLLTAPFKGDKCPSLIGKPKIFFIQACRGSKLDHGVEVAADGDDTTDAPVRRIPSEADFLLAYSTVPGYFSWRNSTKGSWFVQAICRVFEEHSQDKEIMWMMTRVNRMVAYEFESNAAKIDMTAKKQIPCIVSLLTKELYFRSKKA